MRVNFGRVAYENVAMAASVASPLVATSVAAGSFLIELSTQYTFYLIW